MSNDNEKMILVPLSPAVKERLERIADLNGRSTAREAAWAIAQYVRCFDAKIDFASAEGGVRRAE